MGRILAIDYGRRRCGLAVTDILRICANGLPTIHTSGLESFIVDFCNREKVDIIVIGRPLTLNGDESESMRYIRPFYNRLRKLLPNMDIRFFDERFTSSIAQKEMISGQMKKSDRAKKGNIDKIAAVLILTDFLNSRSFAVT